MQEEPPVPSRSGARRGVPPPPPSLASGTLRWRPQRSSPGTEGRVSRAPGTAPATAPLALSRCPSGTEGFRSLVPQPRCPPAPFGSIPVSLRSLTGRSDPAQRGSSRRAAAMSAGSRDRAHPPHVTVAEGAWLQRSRGRGPGPGPCSALSPGPLRPSCPLSPSAAIPYLSPGAVPRRRGARVVLRHLSLLHCPAARPPRTYTGGFAAGRCAEQTRRCLFWGGPRSAPGVTGVTGL